MGQKGHPKSIRIGITDTWLSRWYADAKNTPRYINEDIKIRKHINKNLSTAAISKIEIERTAAKLRVIIHSGKPGIIIGKKGKDIEDLRSTLKRLVDKDVALNIVETRKPDLDAHLLAVNIANQLQRRANYRRVAKDGIERAMRAGAKGVKIRVSGRLNGAEIARAEFYKKGRVPLHTLRADIDYAAVQAHTTYGVIGVSTWIFKGEVFVQEKENVETVQL